jgi:DnaJ-class molecular chaperone
MDLSMSRDGREETVTIKIPPGVRDGQRIRIRGKGYPSQTPGKAGDLYIVCRVQPHPYFRRVDDDIYLELPLALTEAALGTKVEIPTLEGRTVLTIPPGTPSGAKLRLKNLGVKPPGDKPRGHQYAIVRIVPPKPLTPEQVSLLEQFHRCGENSPRTDIGW